MMRKICFNFMLLLSCTTFGQNETSGTSKSEGDFEQSLTLNADYFFGILNKSKLHFDNLEWDSTIFYSIEAYNFYASKPLPTTALFFEIRDSYFKQQISFIDKMITFNRKNVMLLVNRANFNSALKNYKEAVADCSKAIAIVPNDFEILFSRGFAYLKLGDHKKAIKDFSNCLLLRPNHPFAILNRGYSLMETERYSEAIKDFLLSVKLNPKDIENAYGLNNIGYCYYKMKEYGKAESYVLESIEMLPHNSYAFRNLALINLALGKKELACDQIEKSISLGAKDHFGKEILELRNENCN